MADQNSSSASDLKMVPPPNLPTGRPSPDIERRIEPDSSHFPLKPVTPPVPPPLPRPVPPLVTTPSRPPVPPPPAVPPVPRSPVPVPPPVTAKPITPTTPIPAGMGRPSPDVAVAPAAPSQGDAKRSADSNLGTGTPPPAFQSSLRTMQQDLASLQKGQAPAPVSLPNRIEPSKPPAAIPTAPPLPKPTLPQTNLGGMEKARTMPAMPTPRPLTPAPVAPAVSVPSAKKPLFSGVGLVVILLVLLVGGLALWFFFFRESASEIADEPVATDTYSPTPRPRPPLETVFSSVDSVTVPVSPDYFTAVKASLAPLQLSSINEPALYKPFVMVASGSSSERITFSQFAEGTASHIPAAVITGAIDDQFYLTLMRQANGQLSQGFIVKLQPNALEGPAVRAALSTWEPTMGTDLRMLFAIDPKKATGKTFLENTYQGTTVRYRNYPGPDMTIDYALVAAPNGDNYLVFVSSKQHIYAVIDRIMMIATGETLSPTPGLSEPPVPGK